MKFQYIEHFAINKLYNILLYLIDKRIMYNQ